MLDEIDAALDDRNVECRSPPIEDADLHGRPVVGHEHDDVTGGEGGELVSEGASAGPRSDGPHPDAAEAVGRVVGDGPGRAGTDEDDAPGGDVPGDLTLRLVHE